MEAKVVLMLTQFRARALAGVVAVLIAAGCSGSGSSGLAPQAGGSGGSGVAPATKFRAATAADKTQAQQRPSLQAGTDKIAQNAGGTGGGSSSGKFTLVTSLTIDDGGNFGEWSKYCQKSIWDAPWYWSEGNFSLPVADSTSLAVCKQKSDNDGGRHDDSIAMNQPQITPTPSPTASPTPSGTPTNLYIVKLDIGWWSISVKPVSGAATVSADGTTWSFPAMTSSDSFQDDHLYAFFVASWSGSTPPSP